jgi:hypothetical protein
MAHRIVFKDTIKGSKAFIYDRGPRPTTMRIAIYSPSEIMLVKDSQVYVYHIRERINDHEVRATLVNVKEMIV